MLALQQTSFKGLSLHDPARAVVHFMPTLQDLRHWEQMTAYSADDRLWSDVQQSPFLDKIHKFPQTTPGISPQYPACGLCRRTALQNPVSAAVACVSQCKIHTSITAMLMLTVLPPNVLPVT